MIEVAGLKIGAIGCDFGQRSGGQDLVGDVADGTIDDLVDEADVLVLAGRHARDHLASRHLGIDDRFAAAASIVDHHDKILHLD